MPSAKTSGRSSSGPESRNAKNGQMRIPMPAALAMVRRRRPTRSEIQPQRGVVSTLKADTMSTAVSALPESPRFSAR
ncbi:hypothetical protein CMMCAS05_02265 [Clavibacter michiganensis subsp. michiganensis]|nr:hypothetical protein CMMCAS05_02265 [Clavibacter michiganensis subsp. michiganensis]